jgi:DNA-binding NtrC family response regulator
MTNNRENKTILIVERDASQQRFLATLLGRGGWRAAMVEDPEGAVAYLASAHGQSVDALLIDANNKDFAVPQFVADALMWNPHLPIVAMVNQDSVYEAIGVMRAGASDFVQKPFTADRLLGALERLTQETCASGEMRPLSEKLRAHLAFDEIVGSSPNFRAALAIAAKAARSRVPVLIQGRSGTGKEVFARAIHSASPRARGPLMMLDCSALAPGLIASGLFGHERGAFPGAFDRQIGHLQQADGGSMIIDHVECLPPDAQARLIHFLSTGDLQTVGGNMLQRVDVRVIATSSNPLDRLIDSGHFREDLFHALSAAQLSLPQLSERCSDIAPLTRHLLARIGTLPDMPQASITDEALRLLASYTWPANVRQLQDVLFRATLSNSSGMLHASDFPALQASIGAATSSSRIRDQKITVHGEAVGVTLYQPDGHLRPLEDIEADVIRLAIGHYRGRMSEVARRLGIGRSTLYRKLSDLGIETAA